MKAKDDSNLTRREFIQKTAKTAATVSLSSISASAITGCSSIQLSKNTKYDVLIKGGMVYDGVLDKPFPADIGIKNDKIVDIGDLEDNASKTIDATGLTVTPGFIDVHTHCDLSFKRTGLKRYLAYVFPSFKGNYNFQYQGVTSVITGLCGLGYTDTDYWFDIVDSVGFGSNVYHLAPHGMIRMELFGKKQPRNLSQSQLAALKKRVAQEMEKGAIGLSTGLEYAPGLISPTQELIELCKVTAKYGGHYVTHIRDLTGTIHNDGQPGVIKTLKEAVEIGKRAEISVQISHLGCKVPFNNVSASQILDVMDQARHEGLDILADQFPYASGITFLSSRLPIEFKSDSGIKEEYKTKKNRPLLKKAVENRLAQSGPDKVMIAIYPENESYEGKSLKEIAETAGRSAADVYVEMLYEDYAPFAIFFDHNQEVMNEILKYDHLITASDGYTVPKDITKPHPLGYGTFPKKLRKYALDEKVIDLSKAIRSMTSLPAEKFNLKGRGKIKAGNFADIAVLNLNTITDHATYRKPHQYAEGVVHLFVNGVHSIENGKATGDRGGKGIRG